MQPLFVASPFGHFGRRHLGFLESEVTLFGREGGAELAADAQQ